MTPIILLSRNAHWAVLAAALSLVIGRHVIKIDMSPMRPNRIRVAMDRILGGTAENSNGALTIVALAQESGVPCNALTQVEGDHYLTATTPSQRRAIEAIVEDAQHDLLRKAHPPTVVTDEDAITLARDYPQLVAALNLDDTVIAELVGRNASVVDRADEHGTLTWTLPLDRLETIAVVGIVRTAAIILLAAVSGMRSSSTDGTGSRQLPPTRALRTRAGPLPVGQQSHQRPAVGRPRRRMGRHRTRLPGCPTARTAT